MFTEALFKAFILVISRKFPSNTYEEVNRIFYTSEFATLLIITFRECHYICLFGCCISTSGRDFTTIPYYADNPQQSLVAREHIPPAPCSSRIDYFWSNFKKRRDAREKLLSLSYGTYFWIAKNYSEQQILTQGNQSYYLQNTWILNRALWIVYTELALRMQTPFTNCTEIFLWKSPFI